ncbi:MAG: hypothetical protein PHC90_13240 [Syntrophorhabdaceae bacterium]|nr:hypothetical protein [Syntrophorhabdaceae bacterium]
MEIITNQAPDTETVVKTYEGFSRNTFLKYFFFIIALKVVFALMVVSTQGKRMNEICILAFALIVPISFYAVVQRLKNIGAGQKWSLLVLIPLLNLPLLIGCLICPEGYWNTKKLDLTAKISTGIIACLAGILLIICLVVRMVKG